MKEATGQLLDKAERSIEAARLLAAESDYDFAASRAYYARFYIAEALLNEQGLHFRKHSAVHPAYGEHFAKTGALDPKFHRWLLDSSDKRLLGDYEVGDMLTSEDVAQVVDQATEFLGAAREFLKQNPAASSVDSPPSLDLQ